MIIFFDAPRKLEKRGSVIMRTWMSYGIGYKEDNAWTDDGKANPLWIEGMKIALQYETLILMKGVKRRLRLLVNVEEN